MNRTYAVALTVLGMVGAVLVVSAPEIPPEVRTWTTLIGGMLIGWSIGTLGAHAYYRAES